MKAIALLIAALMILVGLTGILWPEGFIQLIPVSFSRTGLYIVSAARVVLGGLLFFAASATRTPKTIRVISLIILTAGIVGAFLPAENIASLKEWLLARSSDFMRIGACLPLAIGIFVGFSALTKEGKR